MDLNPTVSDGGCLLIVRSIPPVTGHQAWHQKGDFELKKTLLWVLC